MQETESFRSQVFGKHPETQAEPSVAPAIQPAPASNPRSRCGRKPFGYYTGEKAIIRKMVELRAQGMGFDRLAEQLNEESVPSRSGKPWHGRVVNRILKAELGRD